MTIRILLNGEAQSADVALSLAAALQNWGYRDAAVAVAINGEFVPRSSYVQLRLGDGDSIEVVGAVEGG